MRIGRVALVLALAAPLVAEQPSPTDFAKGLEKVRALLHRGKAVKGKTSLLELLDEHKEQGYVRARLHDVKALMKQCEFRKHHPAPQPRSVVSGELKSYDPRTGKIKVRYTPETMGDWERHKTTYYHPAAFAGPHAITMKGRRYPNSGPGPMIVVCNRRDECYFVSFGRHSQSTYFPADILHQRGREEVASTQKDKSPCKVGKKWSCQARVAKGAVSMVYNGKKVLSLRKSSKLWGRAAVSPRADWDEILLEGVAERAWIQGLVDKESTKQLKEFEARYKERDLLPAWLFEKAAPATTLARPDGRVFPGSVEQGSLVGWNRVMEMLSKGRLDDALQYVKTSSELDGHDALRAYCRAILCQYTGRVEEGLEACGEVIALDPDFVPALEIKAKLLAQTEGGEEEGLALYRALTAKYPGGADLHAHAARFMMRLGRAKEARTLLDGAIARGVTSELLRKTNRFMRLGERGPEWSRKYEYKSKHYHVISDMDKRTCIEAAKLLEESYTAYIVRLERVKDAEKRRFRVFLFSGTEGYNRFCKELIGTEVRMSAGLYTPDLKVLLIWNLPQRDQMMATVKHEGFHQYLDRIMDNPPRWFNEGLAEYYEISRIVNGRWKLGDIHPQDRPMLKKGTMPLSKWLFISDAAFMGNASFHYAQSWAFIHFLRHSTRENKELFDRFWEAFKANPNPKAAIRHALGRRDLAELDRAFRAHVQELP